jgi:hypothetical protein
MKSVKANDIIPYINAICKQSIQAVANNPEVSIYQAEKLCDKYKMDENTKAELLAYLYLGVSNKALKKRVEQLEKELKESNEKLLQLDREWLEYDAKREAEWNKYADEMQAWIEQMPQSPQTSQIASPSNDEEDWVISSHPTESDESTLADELVTLVLHEVPQVETTDSLAAENIKLHNNTWSEEQYKQVKAEAEAKGLDTTDLLPF